MAEESLRMRNMEGSKVFEEEEKTRGELKELTNLFSYMFSALSSCSVLDTYLAAYSDFAALSFSVWGTFCAGVGRKKGNGRQGRCVVEMRS